MSGFRRFRLKWRLRWCVKILDFGVRALNSRIIDAVSVPIARLRNVAVCAVRSDHCHCDSEKKNTIFSLRKAAGLLNTVRSEVIKNAVALSETVCRN